MQGKNTQGQWTHKQSNSSENVYGNSGIRSGVPLVGPVVHPNRAYEIGKIRELCVQVRSVLASADRQFDLKYDSQLP